MTIINTKRLSLRPMTEEDLVLIMRDVSALEAAWGCVYDGEQLAGDMLLVLGKQRALLQKNHLLPAYSTMWMMLRENTVIGSLCFKGSPDAQGRVEIGYGIAPQYEGMGYTTEAAFALCRFALAQPEVRAIIAETEKRNYASQRVLQKCGMTRYKQTENSYWWRLERTEHP